ncbi:MAG TPA: glycosyltransferase family 9 protein [Gammaproteobacteria bacterium]|nr:glycosyltransferase family 9 protein [Gammaproteobacteria bacterium]
MHEPRVAVVRALHGLGDMLCAVPALRALRSAYPRAEVTLIGSPQAAWIVERFGDYVDALLPFPGFPGIPEAVYSPAALAEFLRGVQAQPFDIAIQMHGSGVVSNAFTALLGAPCMVGLYCPGQFCPAPETFFLYPDHGSEIRRWLHLTEALDCPECDDRLFFPLRPEDRTALEAHPLLAGLEPGHYVLVHPGARDLLRRWPAACFAAVADALAERGYRIVLTGTAAERRTADTVARLMSHEARNVAGDTSLGTAAALLEQAALLVCNDTGISHLAAALGTRSVIVFLASDPDRWAPLERRRHRPVLARSLAGQRVDDVEALHCSRRDVPDAEEVLEEAFSVLGIEAEHA